MIKLAFSKADLTRPTNPDTFRIEQAIDCYGEECGCAFHDDEGNLEPLPPHDHLVVSQKGAASETFPVGGSLPG
jgi:hypothetical protein